MAFDDKFRLSSHAVITNVDGHVLLLKATYNKQSWGLPGGALEPGETIHQALLRECQEELHCAVTINYLSGVYYHSAYQSQVFIFRCELSSPKAHIILSEEHSDYCYMAVSELSPTQQHRVEDCIHYTGSVKSAVF